MTAPRPLSTAPTSDAALDLLLDGAVAAYSIPLRPDWRAAALQNLRTIADAADLVRGAALDDHQEPAAVYRP